MNQENILHEILQCQKKIDGLQKQINSYVLLNRQAVKKDPTFEDGYTESIESYHVNI